MDAFELWCGGRLLRFSWTAEDRISELEDRMVEINESERIKENELKEMRTISETSRTILNATTFES